MEPGIAAWGKLTWDDLESWVGSRSLSRGKAYQKEGRVRELGLCDDGSVLATVMGTERYVTRVAMEETKRNRSPRLSSQCSCPVAVDCKHAVAVVIDLIKLLLDGVPIPKTRADDPRWKVLSGERADASDAPQAAKSGKRSPAKKQTKSRGARLRSFLESKSKEELVELLLRTCAGDSALRQQLTDEAALAGGLLDELLEAARSEMRGLTAQEAWYSGWDDEGELPDYSGLRKRLQTLVERGYADAVVQLGRELMQRGTEQVGRSNDEGETAGELIECMDIVADALSKSSLSDAEKLLTAYELTYDDEYNLSMPLSNLFRRKWSKQVWSEVADRLREQLAQTPRLHNKPVLKDYQRERLGTWIINALDKAGRGGEARELCVAEARVTGSYPQAVERLIADRQIAEAETLALEGLRTVDPMYRGVIGHLIKLLAEIARKRKDWPAVAAIAASQFFTDPGVASFNALCQAAERAGCRPAVEQAARHFLETGARPDLDSRGIPHSQPPQAWPLPPAPPTPRSPESTSAQRFRSQPYFDVLIDLAIHEKRPDDVVRWFDGLVAQGDWRGRPNRAHLRIAEAIAATHLDRAVAIYRNLAMTTAADTNVQTYPEVAAYMKSIKRLLQQAGREDQWLAILQDMRTQHGRKPRLMEALDQVATRRVADALSFRRPPPQSRRQ
ncbi:MAG: SWIM zinc finger family protein [Aureliella sp.]